MVSNGLIKEDIDSVLLEVSLIQRQNYAAEPAFFPSHFRVLLPLLRPVDMAPVCKPL